MSVLLAQVATPGGGSVALAQSVVDPAAREPTPTYRDGHLHLGTVEVGWLWTTAANWVGDVAQASATVPTAMSVSMPVDRDHDAANG